MELYPENSWSGLEASLKLGAKWIECDIQMTTPGHFILLHDADFQRTAGENLSAFGLTADQMMTLSVHEPGRLGTQFHPEPVISLDELLIKIPLYPDARAMVEIKEESIQHWGLEAVMKPLLIQLEPVKRQCVLISFSLDALEYANKNSGIELGLVLRNYDDASLAAAHTLSPAFVICNYKKLPPDTPPTRGPWQWMLYDITDPILAEQWAELGIDLIETRDIGLLLKYVDQNSIYRQTS
ncbi:glycerophosphodiester phosphodiesterase family protein [Sedimenticola selenatireducens]|nr:glycerophosphodiester phosphodiesterase family protein [Sedimenticola selenatireducens]